MSVCLPAVPSRVSIYYCFYCRFRIGEVKCDKKDVYVKVCFIILRSNLCKMYIVHWFEFFRRCQCSCSMVLPSTSPVPSVIESQDKSLEENQSKTDNKISKVELKIYFVKKCTSTILILIFIRTMRGFFFAFFNPR